MRRNNRKGFTIVELVIVIAVIAILAGVLIPTFAGIISKANISKAQQEAAALYKEVYALDMSDGKLDKLDHGKEIVVTGKTFTYEIVENTPNFSCAVDKYTASFDGTNWTVVETPENSTPVTPDAPADDENADAGNDGADAGNDGANA